MNVDLLNSVVSSVARAIHDQTTALDQGGADAAERAACLIAALRAYASVIEEVSILPENRSAVAELTAVTTKTLMARLRGTPP